MSQELRINHEQVSALFNKYGGLEAVQKGNRLVMFFSDDIGAEQLVNISDLKMVSEYSKEQIRGFGAVFLNPQDNCQQAVILRNEDGTPKKGCLIIRLPENPVDAKDIADRIQYAIQAKIPSIKSAKDIKEAADIAAEIAGDVYCSDIGWFQRSTQKFSLDSPETNLKGFNLVRAKGSKVKVLLAEARGAELLFDSGIAMEPQKSKNGTMYLINENEKCRGCASDVFPELFGIMGKEGLMAIDPGAFPHIDLSTEEFALEAMGAGASYALH